MIIVDASVAVKWFVPEPGSEEAEALIDQDVVRAAPEHIEVEVGQALLRHRRAGGITIDHVRESLRRLAKVVAVQPTPWFVSDAIEISDASGCSVYDGLYVAAAERWDCPVVTADQKLKNKLAGSRWDSRVLLLRMPSAAMWGQDHP